MTASRITAIVLTLNEEEHLADCLASLDGLVHRTIVIDSGSTDLTLEIARARGAEVVQSPFKGYASQRNEGLRLAGDTGWVLFLDADERLTVESRAEIHSSVRASNDDQAGFWLPRRNIAFGRVLHGGGWCPDYQARLIRAGFGRYDLSKEVHEVVQFSGPTGRLEEPIVHLNYNTRREFMHKQRAYTRHYVQLASGETPRKRACVGRPLREFWRRFVVLRGYRDRGDGFFMAAVMALEELRACLMLRRRSRT